jgi:hypothetical protein
MSSTGVYAIKEMFEVLLARRKISSRNCFSLGLLRLVTMERPRGGDGLSGDVAKGTKDGEGYGARCCNNFAIYEVRYWKAEGKWYFMRGGYLYMFL